MSYQQTFRSASNPVGSYAPSPASSIHKKPGNYTSSLRSVSPLPQPVNQLQSPVQSTPLNSFPPAQGPPPKQWSAEAYATEPISRTNTGGSYKNGYDGNPYTKVNIISQPPRSTPSPAPAQHQPSQPRSQQQPPPPQSTIPQPASLSQKEIDHALQTVLNIQNWAVKEHSKRPFAALLLAPDNTTVLQTHNSISHYQHAESELARLAAAQYGPTYIANCTLVSTWEPCAMCAGTIYWTGIGKVLYAASEERLKELTGPNNPENMTLGLPCRTIFSSGQRQVEVIGPLSQWEQKVIEDSRLWWMERQAGSKADNGRALNGSSTNSSNGYGHSRDNASVASRKTSVSIYNPEESFLGSIGEDGEYQADLKVDWMP